MSLADKAGLKQGDLLDVLGLGAMANPMFGECSCNNGSSRRPEALHVQTGQQLLYLSWQLMDSTAEWS